MGVAISFDDVSKAGADTSPGWRFNVYLPDLPGLAAPQLVRAVNVTLPMQYVDTDSIFRGGFMEMFPTVTGTDSLEIQLLETAKWDCLRYLTKWRSLQVDENGLWGLPSEYKKDILIYPLTHLGESAIGIRVKRAQPTRPQPTQMNGASSELVHLGLTFTCDRVVIDTDTVPQTSGSPSQGTGNPALDPTNPGSALAPPTDNNTTEAGSVANGSTAFA